jgi:cytochrome c-type biogenesis protein CcmE
MQVKTLWGGGKMEGESAHYCFVKMAQPGQIAHQSFPSVGGIGLFLRPDCTVMKKIHIILLLLIIAGIVGMSFFVKDLTTYETFATAGEKANKFVVVKVQLDKTAAIEYNQIKDPNKTVFYAIDKEGMRSRVVYNNSKPTDIERSEGIDLNGYMRGDHFECTKLQMKCPSKYKDNMKAAEKSLPTAATTDAPKYQ